MTQGELFDVSLGVYQTLGWTILKRIALPALFCLIAGAFVFYYALPSYYFTRQPDSEEAQLIEMLLTSIFSFFIAGPLFLIGSAWATILVTRYVADYMLSQLMDESGAQRAVRRTLFRTILLGLRQLGLSLVGVAIGFGLLILSWAGDRWMNSETASAIFYPLGIMGIAVGIGWFLYCQGRHGLLVPVAVIEGLHGKAALKRSKELVRAIPFHGSGTSNLSALMILLIFLVLLLGFGFQGLLSLLPLHDAARALNLVPIVEAVLTESLALLPWFIVIWVCLPVWAATTTLIYFERRIRLEGLDVEHLSRDVWRADRQSRFLL